MGFPPEEGQERFSLLGLPRAVILPGESDERMKVQEILILVNIH